MATKQLDCKGFGCPLPIIKTAEEMKKLASGETLEVITDDKSCMLDMQVLQKFGLCSLVKTTTIGAITTTILERK